MKQQRGLPNESSSRLFTVRQAAAFLEVPTPTMYRWIGQKLIPAFNLGPTGRTKRVPRAALAAILAKSASGDVGATVRGSTWFKPTTFAIQAASASTDEEVMATTVARPRIPLVAVRRLSDLEIRYKVGSAQVVLATLRGSTPPGIPKKVAHEWNTLFTRIAPIAGE